MKIGVSSYSFSQYIRAGKMTQFDAVAKAKEMGFDAIEFTELNPPEGESKLSYAKRICEEAKKCNIEISAYVVGANLAKKDTTEEVQKLKERIDEAHALGAKLFRHDVMYGYDDFRSFDLALPTIVAAIREVTDYAQKLGIRTMSENHGHIAQDSDRMERLFNAVNNENYGALIDIGNFACADENSAKAVSRLANFAFMVHAKDFLKVPFAPEAPEGCFQTRGANYLKGMPVGKGDIPVAQCFAILKRAGFDGYVDIEYEGADDCMEGIAEGLLYLKSILS